VLPDNGPGDTPANRSYPRSCEPFHTVGNSVLYPGRHALNFFKSAAPSSHPTPHPHTALVAAVDVKF
jgi:hypothetical protein